MTRKKLGAFALVIGSLIIFALPAGSFGSTSAELKAAREALAKAGQQLQAGLESTVQKTGERRPALVNKTKAGLKKATRVQDARDRDRSGDAAADARHEPARSGQRRRRRPRPELRASAGRRSRRRRLRRGRRRRPRPRRANADGTYHGHISAVGLFGNDVIPVDTAQGETKDGPLQRLQANVLDPLCTIDQPAGLPDRADGMHSATTAHELDERLRRRAGIAARARRRRRRQPGRRSARTRACQPRAAPPTRRTSATSTGTAVAQVAKSSSTSKSCNGRGAGRHEHLRGHRPRRHRRPAAGRRLRERHAGHAGGSAGPAADHLQRRGARGQQRRRA